MKKRFCLALGLALSLTACDSKDEPKAKQEPAAQTVTPAAEAKAPAAETAAPVAEPAAPAVEAPAADSTAPATDSAATPAVDTAAAVAPTADTAAPATEVAPAAETAAPAADTVKAEPAKPLTKKEQAYKMLEGVELSNKGLRDVYYRKTLNEQFDIDMTLLEHDSAYVRSYVFGRMIRSYLNNSDELEAFVNHLKKDKNEDVLEAALRSLSTNIRHNKDLYNMALSAAKSKNAELRLQAIYALTNSNNRNVPGIYDKTLKYLNDKDPKVRKAVCKYLPSHGNEKIIPSLVKILNSKKKDDIEIQNDCLEGLVSMWYSWPMFDTQSEAAYKATIKYLKKTPRSETQPAYHGFSGLTRSYEKKPEWKQAATYFKPEEVISIMVDIAKDPAVYWMGRQKAIEVVANLGTKQDLEAIEAGMKDANSLVKRALEKAIADKQ